MFTLEIQVGGNIGVFGSIEHKIVLPSGVQEQLDRMEAKIDKLTPTETEKPRLVLTIGPFSEQP